jgi:[FeFe] hydrogenase H-cluster maturation GTPase HydF
METKDSNLDIDLTPGASASFASSAVKRPSDSSATPKGFRLHIGIFGRRNAGKSSLLNAITRQQVSIVSELAGTTTDPVEKPMELLPLGPVLFIDTAGIDDAGALGDLRVHKTRQIFSRTDLGVLVAESHVWGSFEEQILNELRSREIPLVVVFNKCDLRPPDPAILDRLTERGVPWVRTSAVEGSGIEDFRRALLANAPEEFAASPTIVRDLVGPGELAVLVVPIDTEAPKGRLKMLEVQAIRDLLDGHSACLVVQDGGLAGALDSLKHLPKLVVTDSQVFGRVSAVTPSGVPLTGFSILLSRLKGDLQTQALGALAMASLVPGDRVLVAEACSHHPIGEDIGRVKIPRWLTRHVGGALQFTTVQGHDFPEDLSPYKLVIHCGACMLNRREMLGRIQDCRRQGVPVTNYGVAIAYLFGILERALEPFPAVLAAYREAKRKNVPAGGGVGIADRQHKPSTRCGVESNGL